MGSAALIAGALACGVAAAAPLLLQMRADVPSMAWGLAGVVFAFALIQLALFAVHAAAPQLLMPFAVLAVLTFLSVTLLAALRR